MYPNYNDLRETTSENDLKTSRKNIPQLKIFKRSPNEMSKRDIDGV